MSETDPIDLSSWLTKQQAADAMGCSTKHVERLAAAGKLQQGAWSPQGRGPAKAVYHPADVERLAKERRTTPGTFVVPAGAAVPPNGNGNGARDPYSTHTDHPGMELTLPPGDDPIRLLFAAALRAVMSQTSQTSPVSETPTAWMTTTEVARAWRWPRADVVALIATGALGSIFPLGPESRRRFVVRRSAVEAFAAGKPDLEAL